MERNCQAMLQDLMDKEAIRDCLYRYCRGIDRADEAVLRSAYWPDAHDRHGAYAGDAEGFFAQALPRLRSGGRGVHQISNILIELHGDVAAVESSFLALQASAAMPTRETFLCGRYLDRFEKRQGQWRVANRLVVYDWIEERIRPELAREDADLFGKRRPNGGRLPKDPLYAFLDAVRATPTLLGREDAI
ncbi:nuclear transport factor 2 family protein [Alicycliphilus denitrificans]|uniref:Gamma-BHC dehydrochlorinase n=1 Tax=Alicycliphilus denitrificans (strain DSM 14773 / CIP 107495 / K601) TaxID=596154 RepID=F4GB65_ALIDK|nr:nuclear transport factor 2 family protein [Alicycliphilus denitrificans]AEB83556.1 gamma-BHC dehydrochlorinase [Alicycliphilus denitrificans K601]